MPDINQIHWTTKLLLDKSSNFLVDDKELEWIFDDNVIMITPPGVTVSVIMPFDGSKLVVSCFDEEDKPVIGNTLPIDAPVQEIITSFQRLLAEVIG